MRRAATSSPEHAAAGPRHWLQAPLAGVLAGLHAGPGGLSNRQAAARRRRHGTNELRPPPGASMAWRVAHRLLDPLVAVLIVASGIAALTGDRISFGIVAVVVAFSVALDLLQEHRAGHAVEALQRSVALRVQAWRDGRPVELAADRLVPGDVVELCAGRFVPADGRLLQASDFFVDQAALTGEAWPVEKRAVDSPMAGGEPFAAEGAVFQGSHVVSGSARLLVCATGSSTEFGRLAQALATEPPPTDFERGTRRFGLLLTRATIAMVLFVLLVNTLHQRPLLESFLFAVALAVGLTPELLPMIVSVTLARGAVRLSHQRVIVKRLSAVQDLGAMDVLCTDKTGTLTEAALRVEGTLDAAGAESPHVFALAWLNAHFETGLKGALDDAIVAHGSPPGGADGWRKLDEVPFDFERRRVSVLLEDGHGRRLLIVKGAPEDVLRLSVAVDDGSGSTPALADDRRSAIDSLFEQAGARGLRLLAVASRRIDDGTVDVTAADEHDLAFAGFIAFADPPKASTAPMLAELQAHGVALKVVTGDNEAVTRHLCESLALPVTGVLTGDRIAGMDDAALRAAVERANLFCRVTPEQKNRIVRALRAAGHVVGYLGDGVNDAPPLHSADVGISVDGAVDVARQAADLVLLEHELSVLLDGVREGRRTLLNVNKYIRMATSSNFGNMASMAAAALFLPFLPMRPVQVLLNNLLYDVSELAIPADRVDESELRTPRRWDIAAIRNFMLAFGLLSSAFDLATFAVLQAVLKVPVEQFQTAWFVESMATQVLVIFVIRGSGPSWRDRPSPWLAASSLGVVALAVALPWLGLGGLFGFVPLPGSVLACLAGLTLGYLASAEALKALIPRLSRIKAGGRAMPTMAR